MKRLAFLFVLCISCCVLKAQELVVDSFKLLPDDKEVLENPKYDGNDYICALIKVYVNDLPDLGFSSSYLIDRNDIKYNKGSYYVYVSQGIRSLDIKHGDYLPIKVNFEQDFNIPIEGGNVYALNLSTTGQKIKPTQTVIFHVIPRTGEISINGESFALDNGSLQKEFSPGTYDYTISSDCYYPVTKQFTVTDISQAQNVTEKLEPVMCKVFIGVQNDVKGAELSVDNRKKPSLGYVELPMGWRNILIKAPNWKDYKKKEWIEPGKEIKVKLEPKQYFPVVITHKGGYQNPVLYINNKEVPTWRNDGKPIMVKGGKQYVTIIEKLPSKTSSGYSTTKDGRNNSKYVTFTPDMDPVSI